MAISKSRWLLLSMATSVVIAIDQITKAIVRRELTVCSGPPVSLCDRVSIGGPVGLLRTENGDGAFGLLSGEAIGPALLVLLGILVWQAARLPRTPWLALAVGLQLGGLLANLADRAVFGVVTDFIDLRWGLADQGVVLNPADLGLGAGGVILAFVLFGGVSGLERATNAGPSTGSRVLHSSQHA